MRALVFTGLLLFMVGGCAHRQVVAAGPRAEVILSLQEINCQSCGAASVRALERRPGVYSAHFDRDKVELTVEYDPGRTGPDALVAAVGEVGYEARVGAGHGRYAADVEFPAGLDVTWISRGGEDVPLESHRAPGKVTVFDFYAEWCGPCREVDRTMVSILQEHDDVALRKLDVADWDSAVAKRYLADVPSLPYVVVYGKSGARVNAISGLHLDDLRAAIEEGRKR